ncbi:hypothetical protein CFP56_008114 [Quercus suber]|uniref:Uncharacterized protein n=1 Tax=Quercus suber TaxID=58331 RepID=A0AAW0L3N4_QUESU
MTVHDLLGRLGSGPSDIYNHYQPLSLYKSLITSKIVESVFVFLAFLCLTVCAALLIK